MKKKVVLKGTLCDICGRIIDPYLNEHIYDDGHSDVRCEKKLKVKMVSPFSQRNNSCFGYGNILSQKALVCGRCGFKFEKMFVEWKISCEIEGEEERKKRMLEFEMGDPE